MTLGVPSRAEWSRDWVSVERGEAVRRRPALHTYFGVENKIGVSTVASGKTALAAALVLVELAPQNGNAGADFEEWAKSADARSRLFVLPSGPLPPNPVDIVDSRRFGLIIKALEKEVDLVIVDSSAMLAAGDNAALAAKVDGIVALADMHVLKRPAFLQAVDQLYKLPAKLLGVVVRSDGTGSGGRYAYYGSYYGYYQCDGRDGERGKRGGCEAAGDDVRGKCVAGPVAGTHARGARTHSSV